MAQQQIVISPTMLAVFLAGAGAVWLLTRNRPTQQQTPAPQSAQTDLDVIKRLQEAEAKREAAWREADQIRELQRSYDRAANEAKQVMVQLSQIDNDNVLPADIVETVKAKHVQFCADNWGIFSFNAQNACNHLRDDGGRWQREAETMHAERKKDLRRPLQTKLDNLQNDMQEINKNLQELGYPAAKSPTFHRVT